ncbi:alpha/beta superfamily hydrolase [Wolbachia endosymbiont of Cimex lectularius]|nr:alpha/beta superfamily hydrolase [Wolbachia endosymbiont of Cimex lectularius]
MNSVKSDHMEYHIIDDTNHFLRDKEEEVVQIIDDYIKLRLNSAAISSQKTKKEVKIREYA